MKKNKFVLVCFFLLIIFLVLDFFYFFYVADVGTFVNVNDEFFMWNYDNSIYTMDRYDDRILDYYVNRKYDLYSNNSFIGNYMMYRDLYTDYFVDSNNNVVDLDSTYIAFSANSKFKNIFFEAEKVNKSDEVLINILNDNKLVYDDLYEVNKYILDDGSLLYILSVYDGNGGLSGFIVSMYKNNKIYYILREKYSDLIRNYRLIGVYDSGFKNFNYVFSSICGEGTCYSVYSKNKKGDFEEIGVKEKFDPTKVSHFNSLLLSDSIVSYFLIVLPILLIIYICYMLFRNYSEKRNKLLD